MVNEKIRLTEDWRHAHRWFSVQIAGAAMAVQAAMVAYPTIANWLPDYAKHALAFVMFGAIIVGRLIDQKGHEDGSQQKP